MITAQNLEQYFAPFRAKILGVNQTFESPYGVKPIIYADWIASGRLYDGIEQKMLKDFAPYVANTHTETSITGTSMTQAYHKAREIIKAHVGASSNDVLICCDSGMTGAVNKLQRILSLKVPECFRDKVATSEAERPVVFVTHMEHHSNQTSWLETLADVEIIAPTADGLVDLENLKVLLAKYAHRTKKIAAVTSCSNVTGIITPYHEIARMMHAVGGLCFVDFACSAPYVDINMHPEGDEAAKLDAIYFSPHKFLGGPGTSGVLIFCSSLYNNRVPDHPGGGTVAWTNPWKEHQYIADIEAREDGGTPPFLQAIRTALAIKLKEQMGTTNILAREHELLEKTFAAFEQIPNLHILAAQHKDRVGVVSFYIDGLHFNLCVKLLNDRYGIQVRGGCSCAGTYGHYLLNVSQEYSHSITSQIDAGNLTEKPGWIRLSLHPTMTDAELDLVLAAIKDVAANHKAYGEDYVYHKSHNEFYYKSGERAALDMETCFLMS